MKQIVLQGILKKNSMGRNVLVYSDQDGNRKMIRLSGNIIFPSGQTVTLVGSIQSNSFRVERASPRHYPRKAS